MSTVFVVVVMIIGVIIAGFCICKGWELTSSKDAYFLTFAGAAIFTIEVILVAGPGIWVFDSASEVDTSEVVESSEKLPEVHMPEKEISENTPITVSSNTSYELPNETTYTVGDMKDNKKFTVMLHMIDNFLDTPQDDLRYQTLRKTVNHAFGEKIWLSRADRDDLSDFYTAYVKVWASFIDVYTTDGGSTVVQNYVVEVKAEYNEKDASVYIRLNPYTTNSFYDEEVGAQAGYNWFDAVKIGEFNPENYRIE